MVKSLLVSVVEEKREFFDVTLTNASNDEKEQKINLHSVFFFRTISSSDLKENRNIIKESFLSNFCSKIDSGLKVVNLNRITHFFFHPLKIFSNLIFSVLVLCVFRCFFNHFEINLKVKIF